jgi:hypothetical protein
MPVSEFANFVASQQDLKEIPFDWKKELAEYIASVASLYDRATEYLSEYLADGSVNISHDEVEIVEESYGSYRIDRLLIDIGHQRVFLEPVGTMLIGSKGRVDLIGPIKRVPVLLIRESVKKASDLIHVRSGLVGKLPPPPTPATEDGVWVWKLRSVGNVYAFEDLDKESFLAAIIEASRR